MKATHIELFESLAAMPDSTVPIQKKLMVLCTPRCGSTLWAEAMNSCGLLGICEEWLNYEYFEAWSHVTGQEFNLSEYLIWVALKSSRNTGVFCLKLHIGQLVAVSEDHNMDIETLDFDRIIYLYRLDKIAQAVSVCKAVTSGQYRSYEEPTGEPNVTKGGISAALFNVIKFDQFTRKYLWKYVDDSHPYEAFCDLEHFSYRNTLEAMGKPCLVSKLSLGRLKKQADNLSHDAAYNFRRYLNGEIR